MATLTGEQRGDIQLRVSHAITFLQDIDDAFSRGDEDLDQVIEDIVSAQEILAAQLKRLEEING